MCRSSYLHLVKVIYNPMYSWEPLKLLSCILFIVLVRHVNLTSKASTFKTFADQILTDKSE